MTDQPRQSPVILAFDTSGPYCAAALIDRASATTPVLTRVDEMAKGQAEHLLPMVEQMLAQAGRSWSDVAAIGVGIGPGNFTGIRISVSAARGLALGLGIPAIGVSHFEAITFHQEPADPSVAVVPAPRDNVYVQRMDSTPGAPRLMSRAELDALPEPKLLATDQTPSETIRAIAEIAALRQHEGGRPAPLYIKPPDAAPSRDAPPVVVP